MLELMLLYVVLVLVVLWVWVCSGCGRENVLLIRWLVLVFDGLETFSVASFVVEIMLVVVEDL